MAWCSRREMVIGRVQGKKLDYGCSREDYRITVGVANCTITDFTSNEITCQPPVYKPQLNATWNSYCLSSANALALMVSSLRPMSHLRFCRASLTRDSDAHKSRIE